jgi:non-canonical (house-cleaning) NTP pyrophosphatase
MALLTKGVVTRESVYTLALTTALAPFVNSELFNQ